MLAVRLPPEVEQRLTQLAEETGRTKSFYAREAILLYLTDLEARYSQDQVRDVFKAAKVCKKIARTYLCQN